MEALGERGRCLAWQMPESIRVRGSEAWPWLSIPALANAAPDRNQVVAQMVVSLIPTWAMEIEVLVPSFSLVQPCPLQASWTELANGTFCIRCHALYRWFCPLCQPQHLEPKPFPALSLATPTLPVGSPLCRPGSPTR